ncbi:hypothetical protein FI667_g11264, partial [Globisporangium splendens]
MLGESAARVQSDTRPGDHEDTVAADQSTDHEASRDCATGTSAQRGSEIDALSGDCFGYDELAAAADEYSDSSVHEILAAVPASTTPNTAFCSTTARLRAKPTSIASYKRRNNELKLLRREVVTLDAIFQRSTRGLVELGAVPTQTIATIQWQRRAKYQFEQLQQATRENKRLLSIAQEQKKFAKSLQRKLKMRITSAMRVERILLPPRWYSELGESPDDYSVYAKLLTATDAMKAKTDTVVRALKTCVPNRNNGSFRKTEIAYFGTKDITGLRMVESEELPFPKECTSRALQLCLGGESDKSWEFVTEHFGGLPGVVMDKHHIRSTDPNETGTHRIRRVRRTFAPDGDTLVILLISYIDPVNTREEPTQGFVIQERKWKFVRRQQSCGDPDVGSTLVQTYSTMVPDVLSPQYARIWNQELVANKVVPAWNSANSSEHQRLESLLVDCTRA